MTTAIRAIVSHRAQGLRFRFLACLVAPPFLTNGVSNTARAEEALHEMRETTVLFYKDGGLHRVTPATATQKQESWEPPELHLRLDSADMKRLLQYTMTDSLPWEFLGFASTSAKPGAEAARSLKVQATLPEGGPTLRLGSAGATEADLAINATTGHIEPTKPGVITFNTNSPHPPAPGVYRFKVIVRLKVELMKPDDHCDCVFPVEVYVPGRALTGVHFLKRGGDASTLTPHLGDAFRLNVGVLCVGPDCQLGSGRVLLDQVPLEGEPRTLLKSRLPLEEDSPEGQPATGTRDVSIIVPIFDRRFPGNKWAGPIPEESDTDANGEQKPAAGEYWCDLKWRDRPLVASAALQPANRAGPEGLSRSDWMRQHQVQIQLPDAMSLGTWNASVEWATWSPQGSASAPLTATKSLTIQPGLQVAHRVCLLYEPDLKIRAASDRDLGDTLTVEITPPAASTGTADKKSIPLKRTHTGKATLYEGVLSAPTSSGTYSVSAVPVPEQQLPSGLQEPVTYQVCFAVNANAPRMNVVVFGSPIPLDVWFNTEWIKTANLGTPWIETRRNALGLIFDDGSLESAFVRRLPLLKQTSSGGRLVEVQSDADLDEFVSIRPQDSLVDEFQSPSTAGREPHWTERKLTARKWLRWNTTASLTPEAAAADTDESLSPPTTAQQRSIPDRRKQPGVTPYRQHLLLVGEDAHGEYHVRHWYFEQKIERDNQWEHHKYLILFGSLLLAAVAIPAVFVIRSQIVSRRKRADRSSGPVVEFGAKTSTGANGFFDEPVSTAASTEHAQADPAVKSPSEPRSTPQDDASKWLD